MTDINEENKDLIDNMIPLGLLDMATRNRMMSWPHGWQVWNGPGSGWVDVINTASYGLAHRAKPAPDPEPVEVRHEVSITVESPLLPKEMYYRLSFDEKLENPTIEAIE